MSSPPSCQECGLAFEPDDVFCARCGRPAGRIAWAFSADRNTESGTVWVRKGEHFYLLARNIGVAPVRAEVDASMARGLRLEGVPFRRVAPGQVQVFELHHIPESEIGGAIQVRSDDGLRARWWERRSWQERALKISGSVRVREERWVIGSPCVLLPPGVRRQFVRVWNDSELERTFVTETPPETRVMALGVPTGPNPLATAAGASLNFGVEPHASRAEGHLANWKLGPDGHTVPIYRMARARTEKGCDVVVAIDFGTRNTGVRVRWRRTLVPTKPAGTVDAVGDRGGTPRFPTQMIVHRGERTFRWGQEAADAIAASRMSADEVPIANLKTHLREGRDRYTELHPDWTNAELVRRYFERLLHRLDEYFRTASPEHPVRRENLDVRYVLCRPVLDANEGDVEGARYEATLRSALESCGVPGRSITFIHEPVAAAIGVARRREELLALPDGAAVAIVDSGGGTTDVALARVRMEGGRVALDIAGSYAVHLEPDNPAMAILQRYGVEDRQVGGNVLDWALTDGLIRQAGAFLESEGRPVPRTLWKQPEQPGLVAAQMREFVVICRRMKERFARASTQYLNRPPGQPREEGEVLPFPNREDLEGVYLVHALYDEHLLEPILRPAAEDLAERINRASRATAASDPGVPQLANRMEVVEFGSMEDSEPEGPHTSTLPHLHTPTPSLRSTDVRRVFYVGGTNIDPFVRQHFARTFPLAPLENDAASQSEGRIAERLNAVVEGAVWLDEQLFAPSPLTLLLRVGTVEEVVLPEGAALLPASAATARFFTEVLEPGAELDACLVAEGGELPEPVVVARAFYRNDTTNVQEASLRLTTSRSEGQVAELQVGPVRREQWRFALVEEEP